MQRLETAKQRVRWSGDDIPFMYVKTIEFCCQVQVSSLV